MFELLTPIFAVAGGVLAGVPLILHMFRRTPAKRLPFSAVRFLSATLPRTTRRSSPEHWPLMLLRILAVMLIALAFARPFQRVTVDRTEGVGTTERIAVLLDASASMRRDGLRDAVLRELESIISETSSTDIVSVSSYSQGTRRLISADEWQQAAPGSRRTLIDRIRTDYEPDWLSTRTGAALLQSAEEISREDSRAGSPGSRRIVLITDFQEGSDLSELRSGHWPESVRLDLRVVSPDQQGNAGLSLVEETRSGRIRVRVTNSGDSVLTKFRLSPFDVSGQPAGQPMDVEVAGGQRRTFSLKEPSDDQPMIAGVELLGEPHAFDNVVDLPLHDRDVIQIAHFGPDDSNNSEEMIYYLQRAIDGNEAVPCEIVHLLSAEGVALPVPDSVNVAVVTAAIPEGLVTALRAFGERGGTVLIGLRSVEMWESLKSLLPNSPGVTEAVVRDYAMLGQIDFRDPLLLPFADVRFSDFSSIRFWRYRKLQLAGSENSVQVLARFDSGDPAIIASSFSNGGRVILLASGWHPDDSQLALSTRFAPMISRVIALAHSERSGFRLFETGERIRPGELLSGDRWILKDPDGREVTTSELLPAAVQVESARMGKPTDSVADAAPVTVAERSSDEHAPNDKSNDSDSGGDPENRSTIDSAERATESTAASEKLMGIAAEHSGPVKDPGAIVDLGTVVEPGTVVLDRPGRWILETSGRDGTRQLSLLVNVAASESRTAPLPSGQLLALGMSPDVATVAATADHPRPKSRDTQLGPEELESEQKYWRWLLLAGLGCLVLESCVAWVLERQRLPEAV